MQWRNKTSSNSDNEKWRNCSNTIISGVYYSNAFMLPLCTNIYCVSGWMISLPPSPSFFHSLSSCACRYTRERERSLLISLLLPFGLFFLVVLFFLFFLSRFAETNFAQQTNKKDIKNFWQYINLFHCVCICHCHHSAAACKKLYILLLYR